MRLIFLGTGAAFVTDVNNYQSNMLLQSASGKLLLIDCGADVRRSLHSQGFSFRDITDVYISHLHSDHAGGLEWLGFTRKFSTHLTKPNLYLSEHLVAPLWEHTLAGGLTSLSDEPASLSAFFQVHPVADGKNFRWENISFEIIPHRHVESQFAHMPSYGLFFSINGRWVFLTTDAQFQPEQSLPYYQKADYIFQDCEIAAIPSGVHAHYNQLRTLPPEIKAKMWLYHYNSGALPDAVADGFGGFIQPGQQFNF
jgi:ribonuclease BN (tRNA processing enzyme)